MNIYDRNVQVFKDTRKLSVTAYSSETKTMIKNTKVYSEPLAVKHSKRIGRPSITFWQSDSISAVVKLSKQGYQTCVLNFADAITPGGLVEIGECTQEEEICRCTNVYESLISSEPRQKYYNYNQELGGNIFSDRIIYSKNVLLFKESNNYNIINPPITCDVVTCPAPIAFGLSREKYINIITRRINGIIRVCEANGCNAIVLGAWGCGAFCGDAFITGAAFGKALSQILCFDMINFSVIPTKNLTEQDSNYYKLREGFKQGYNTGVI